jgi:hypothetical protein
MDGTAEGYCMRMLWALESGGREKIYVGESML